MNMFGEQLVNDAGQSAAGDALLRQALAIYEKTSDATVMRHHS